MLRLPDLATRGTWDADQGHDMLVLRSFVRDGVVPLLGPPTSIGDVHHGAWYYYLLGPVAAVTGGDSPLAVTALIALAGVAAVGVVWWLARSVGGPLAGAIAGLLMAISTAAIDESTFIWNPNLIALSSAVALAAAWRAWSGHTASWWVVAAIGTALTMQCHVLAVALLPVVAVPFLRDIRDRPGVRRVVAGVVVVFVLAYLPLLLHEVVTGGGELRAAMAYMAGGRDPAEVLLPVRAAIVGLRVVSWPLTGLITDGFVMAALATALVVAIAVWLARTPRGVGGPTDGTAASVDRPAERRIARWFGLGLLWSIAFLTLAAPSLASVVRGLPNDHYHAFADPMVFVLVGVGLAALARTGRGVTLAGSRSIKLGGAVAMTVVVGLAAWNLTRLPPAVHPDGGSPAGLAAGQRVEAALDGGDVDAGAVVRVRSLPSFKSTEAMAYPLAVLGRPFVADLPGQGVAPGSVGPTAAAEATAGGLVLLCDDLFGEANGAPCGGPAEGSVAPDAGGPDHGPLLDRFEAAPGRWVSVYGPPG
jgi:hypothetical protein